MGSSLADIWLTQIKQAFYAMLVRLKATITRTMQRNGPNLEVYNIDSIRGSSTATVDRAIWL